MEIKSMSSISNTNFENFDKLKQTSDVKEEPSKVKVEKAEEIKAVSEEKKGENIKQEVSSEKEVSYVTSENVKSFSYDMDINTFVIIVKDKDGNIQQYPTEDLLKFKQMIKEEVRTELAEELKKK